MGEEANHLRADAVVSFCASTKNESVRVRRLSLHSFRLLCWGHESVPGQPVPLRLPLAVVPRVGRGERFSRFWLFQPIQPEILDKKHYLYQL